VKGEKVSAFVSGQISTQRENKKNARDFVTGADFMRVEYLRVVSRNCIGAR